MSVGAYASLMRGVLDRQTPADFCVSTQFELSSPHSGALLAMDVDKIDNYYAIVGGADGRLSLFDLRGAYRDYFRKKMRVNKIKLSDSKHGHSPGAAITSVQWFPKDCGAFATSSYDMTCKLWDTDSFRAVVDFKFINFVNCCRIHYDGNLVSCALEGNDIRLCDLRTGGNTHVLSAHRRVATGMDFCPSNSNIMASSSLDKSVKIWDLRKGSSNAVLMSLDWRQDHTAAGSMGGDYSSAVAHDGGAMNAKYTSCGTELITCGVDRFLRAWDPTTGALLNEKSNCTTNWNTSHYDIDVSSTIPGLTGIFVPGRKEGTIAMVQMERRLGFPRGFRMVETLTGHVRMVRGMRYIPIRNKLLSVGADGNDPEERNTNTNKRKHGEIQHLSSNRDGVPVGNSYGGRHVGLDDVDMWSDEEEGVGNVQDTSTLREDDEVGATLRSTRFLPPIIRQILEDENRPRNRENSEAGRSRR